MYLSELSYFVRLTQIVFFYNILIYIPLYVCYFYYETFFISNQTKTFLEIKKQGPPHGPQKLSTLNYLKIHTPPPLIP